MNKERILSRPNPDHHEDIERLKSAYERTVSAVDMVSNPIAKKIIELSQTGIRDPGEVSKLGLKQDPR
jgi:hypothetical protein